MSKHGYLKPSHSAQVLILGAPQLSASPSVIREQGVVRLNCEPPLTRASQCYFYPERDKIKSSEVTCDYSLNSDTTVRSPLSDPYDVFRHLPAATQSSITAEQPPADSPGSSTHFSSTTDSTPSELPFSVSLLATNNHCCQSPTDPPKTVNIQPNEHPVENTSPDTENSPGSSTHFSSTTDSTPSELPFSVSLLATNNHITHCCQSPTDPPKTAQTNDLQSPAGPTQSSETRLNFRMLLLLVLSVTGAGVVVFGVAIFSCRSIMKKRFESASLCFFRPCLLLLDPTGRTVICSIKESEEIVYTTVAFTSHAQDQVRE
ncbi:uncharacterized protein [Hoplias malabaricus]|uniref:uncharacterized protein n=1 Tax=Hoplias malabaricus TaxID=27720 RepID=UPI003462FC50